MKQTIIFTLFFYAIGYVVISIPEAKQYANLKERQSLMLLQQWQQNELENIGWLARIIHYKNETLWN